MEDKLSRKEAEGVLDKLAGTADPARFQKVEAQLSAKLEEMERSGQASGRMIDQIRSLWNLLKAPDEITPFKSKAMIMAALMYFASPVDLVPDALGKAGYMDDAMVVNIVYQRMGPEMEAYKQHFHRSP